MVDFQNMYTLKISSDKMTASIQYISKDAKEPILEEQLLKNIEEAGITYGIKQDIIASFISNPEKFRTPTVFALGKKPTTGNDGYLHYEIPTSKRLVDQNQHFINLKEVKQIPSVAKGQKVATIMAPTIGEEGFTVLGEKIPGISGKPFRLRPGKNIMQKENEIIATMDGQVSIGNRTINVFPLYEVSGDLDLKTGNINFIGNVVIRGNVPTGFTIQTQGDIQIYGLVEGATLIAGGSIYITGGIAALNRGTVKAGVDICTLYMNQANVEAGRNIEVERSIFHSKCIAGGDLYCRNGTIVGGILAVSKVLQAKAIGNQMYTKTELFFGVNENIVAQEKTIQQQLRDLEDLLNKLEIARNTLQLKQTQFGKLADQEKQLLDRTTNTIHQFNEKQIHLREELNEIYAMFKDLNDAYLEVTDIVYPNTVLHFGKYAHSINRNYKSVKIHIVDDEFTFSPLERKSLIR